MNTPIVNNAFRFVRQTYQNYLPEGFDQFQLHLAMELKNRWVCLGLQAGLSDERLEQLAITALLCRIGIIENLDDHCQVSQFIAARFLAEEGYPKSKVRQLLQAIAVANQQATPGSRLEQIIVAEQMEEVGDIWP